MAKGNWTKLFPEYRH